MNTQSIIGKKVVLHYMSDPYPLPAGSKGVVVGIDAIGDLLMDWNCGSSLKLIPSIDTFTISSTDSNAVEPIDQEAN